MTNLRAEIAEALGMPEPRWCWGSLEQWVGWQHDLPARIEAALRAAAEFAIADINPALLSDDAVQRAEQAGIAALSGKETE